MSKIGKKPIIIPDGVTVQVTGKEVHVKGSKGELSLIVDTAIGIEMKDKEINLSIGENTKENKSIWGTTRMLIDNMIKGVTEGFEKRLEIQGIGFKAVLQGKNKIILSVGFTHPVELIAPEGVEFKLDKNIIIVSGIDKQKVGQITAEIRASKPPEPYLGKGIRYVGEVVKRKAGKKVVAAAK
ncbi:50S ribosomal protein L6 [Patescibacteria group bacterium]|nr:50S ribosomal protein L6 [Patescibacteria group bacterium]MBU4142255.1 50S ribosomal protein L6 [Patescibacteria group bacterium]MBU4339163.1 50S ribosomal protein L6 [Patescibacteria group bacterium]MBU4580588.1 50S ribosomal protein L6 [Patescibacteria group bacterium]